MFLYRVYRTFFLFCLIVGSFDANADLLEFGCDLPERTEVFRMTQNGTPLSGPERMPGYFELRTDLTQRRIEHLPDILEIRFWNVTIGRILIGDHSSFNNYSSYWSLTAQVLDDNFSISCEKDRMFEPYIILVRRNTNFSTWLFRRVARVFTRGQ
jgi:hypothetical protein